MWETDIETIQKIGLDQKPSSEDGTGRLLTSCQRAKLNVDIRVSFQLEKRRLS